MYKKSTLLTSEVLTKIKVCLIKKDTETLWTLTPLLKPATLFNALQNELKTDFTNYVRYCGNTFKNKFYMVNRGTLLAYCIYGKKKYSDVRSSLQNYIDIDILFEVTQEIHNYITLNFSDQCDFNSDLWLIGERLNQNKRLQFSTYQLDFSSLNEPLKSATKDYLFYLRSQHHLGHRIQQDLANIKVVAAQLLLITEYSVTSAHQINSHHVQHLLLHFQQLKKGNGNKMYALGTIRNIFTTWKIFIDWLIDCERYSITNNPFRKITFHNVANHSKPTEHIPENVIEFLKEKMHELPPDTQNVWTLLINTGMRISEVLGLTENCLEFNPEYNSYVLEYTPSKDNKGDKDKHRIPIPNAVVQAINIQQQLSEKIRIESESSLLFIKKNTTGGHYGITSLRVQTISDQINSLLKKYNITRLDGEIFKYRQHMCRKTKIMEMLEQGFSIREIADYVNHSNEDTTQKYYSEMHLEKIAKLDALMFEKIFEQSLDRDIQQQYNQQEKEALFKEIKLGARETPEGHGHCVKHVSFGPCHKKKCVGCRLLITGPQKLPMWYKLYNEQKEYIKQLEAEFESNYIENFKEYRSYQSEINLLNLYWDTIKKTESLALQMSNIKNTR
ncbi:site-specific integrase [Bacillus cereus]|nr:site-specific integrase [Bacillus cereus]